MLVHYILALLFFVEGQPSRKVTVKFTGGEFVYDVYIIEWGDGKRSYQASKNFPKNWERSHKYAKNGTYVVTLMLRRGYKTFKAFSKMVEVHVAESEAHNGKV